MKFLEATFRIVMREKLSNARFRRSHFRPEVIGVTFFDSCSCSKKVTPAPAPELFGKLNSDSCLHSENLKALPILPHAGKLTV